MDSSVHALIQEHSCGKPTLVFCNSRKSAMRLAEYAKIIGLSRPRWILPEAHLSSRQSIVGAGQSSLPRSQHNEEAGASLLYGGLSVHKADQLRSDPDCRSGEGNLIVWEIFPEDHRIDVSRWPSPDSVVRMPFDMSKCTSRTDDSTYWFLCVASCTSTLAVGVNLVRACAARHHQVDTDVSRIGGIPGAGSLQHPANDRKSWTSRLRQVRVGYVEVLYTYLLLKRDRFVVPQLRHCRDHDGAHHGGQVPAALQVGPMNHALWRFLITDGVCTFTAVDTNFESRARCRSMASKVEARSWAEVRESMSDPVVAVSRCLQIAVTQNTFFATSCSDRAGSLGRVQRLVDEALKTLEENEMISVDGISDCLEPTTLGTLMSHHNIGTDTTRRLARLAQSPASTSYILQTLAGCEEVQEHPIRRSEKKRLNQLNADEIRYRVKSSAAKCAVDSIEMKSNILIQAGIGRLLSQDDPLHAEMLMCMESSQRVLRALVELLVAQARGEAAAIAFNLWRSVKLRSWDEGGGAMNLRQIEGVDEHIAKTLAFTGFRSLRNLASASPEHLKQCIGRDLQFCASVVEKAASITDFSLSVLVRDGGIRIALKSSRTRSHEASEEKEQSCALLVYVPGQLLHFREGVRMGTLLDVAITNAMTEKHRTVTVQLFHEQFAGMDQRLNAAFDQKGEHRSETKANRRSSPTATEALGSKEPSSVEEGDSKLLKAIKKLERHHKSAKQQSMFQYLRAVPESEAGTPAFEAQLSQLTETKAVRRTPVAQQIEQPAFCALGTAYHGDNLRSSAREPTDTPVHVVSPDETVIIEDNAAQAHRSSRQGASRRKRKDGENLFAHFRFKKKPAVMLDVRLPSEVLQSKVVESSPVVAKRSRGATGKARTEQPRPGKAAQIHSTEREAPASSIRSRPFFKEFLQQKGRHDDRALISKPHIRSTRSTVDDMLMHRQRRSTHDPAMIEDAFAVARDSVHLIPEQADGSSFASVFF
ncbi:hypothetical protein PybrP1_008037 [[Pythium] brassicae (nom. inval.)]|nr:hypothetical protein PybrP1_008037 [[Pythium] brassicae (nom. inval.)]